MDIDPLDMVETAVETTEANKSSDKALMRLNMLVAITVAILATFMGICKVKDDNIDQAKKKEELKALAEQDQKDYDAANFKDDQFDLSDALIAIAISLLAVTALTHQSWLYWAALIPTGGGIFMGLSGLLAWNFHPDAVMRLLS